MKHLSTQLLLIIVLVSCQKDFTIDHKQNSYLDNVKAYLRDSLSSEDFSILDFSRAVRTKINGDSLHILRVPFKDRSIESDFLLLQTDIQGNYGRGRIVSINGEVKQREGEGNWPVFYGSIAFHKLNRTLITYSPIEGGYITAFHTKKKDPGLALLAPVAPPKAPDYKALPEVIIMGRATTTGDLSYGAWVSLVGLFGPGGGGGTGYSNGYGENSGYYAPMNYNYDGEGSGNGSSGSYSGSGQKPDPVVYEDEAIEVDFEHVENFPAIELENFLKCFDAVPDNGATCSIEIFTDIPVDKDPNKLFNWQTESPGHTFLQIKKVNGSKSVMQNIGFYPATNWKVMMTPAPVAGMFVDNGEHEFNASFFMNLSLENLKNVLTRIRYLARFIKYDIDEYNCTDFALDVFNEVRTHKLDIPLYEIPGGMAPAGTSTPQGLYNKLTAMKQSGGPEAANISIPGVKGWVAYSDGPCN